MTKMTDEELLQGIDEMIKDAPGVGLCTMPFKLIRDAVSALIDEKDALMQKWVSVDDYLPDPETDVMVAFDDGEVWCLWQNWKAPRDAEDEDPLVYMIDPWEGTSHRVAYWSPMLPSPVSGYKCDYCDSVFERPPVPIVPTLNLDVSAFSSLPIMASSACTLIKGW